MCSTPDGIDDRDGLNGKAADFHPFDVLNA